MKLDGIQESPIDLSLQRGNSARREFETAGLNRNRFERILGFSEVDENVEDNVISDLLGIAQSYQQGEVLKIIIRADQNRDRLGKDIEAPTIFKLYNQDVNQGN